MLTCQRAQERAYRLLRAWRLDCCVASRANSVSSNSLQNENERSRKIAHYQIELQGSGLFAFFDRFFLFVMSFVFVVASFGRVFFSASDVTLCSIFVCLSR